MNETNPAPIPVENTVSVPAPDSVLLAVTGMSPAVLTETVWALAQEPDPVIPSRIIVLTTVAGRDAIEARLFRPSPQFAGRTPWQALRDALRDAGHSVEGRLRFGTTPDDVRVMTSVDPTTGLSCELADIRTPSDNEAAADFLLDQVRGVVENPDTELIASVAGGRKTMGALLYACMTLAGRESDRLTHVLVDEPFEALPDFFFPAQGGGPLCHSKGTLHSPDAARVVLADVPFVPLRNLFLKELGRPAGTFTRLMTRCRDAVRQTTGENLRLSIRESAPEIEVNGTRARLAPREHLLLLFLATRARNSEPPFPSHKEALPTLNEFRSECRRQAPSDNPSDWRFATSLASVLSDDDLRKALSNLKKKLIQAGRGAELLAGCLPIKGRFSLTVPGSLIHLTP